MKNFEAICISSPNEESSSTYLLIMFWQGISSYGFSNILTVGSLIACSNLEIRKTRSASNISLCYCSERTVFTKSPRQAHLLSAFEALNKQITVCIFKIYFYSFRLLLFFKLRFFIPKYFCINSLQYFLFYYFL